MQKFLRAIKSNFVDFAVTYIAEFKSCNFKKAITKEFDV